VGPRLDRGAVSTDGVERAWSMRTLGASYSRTLRTGEAQPLVDEGPYRLVRHPGYAGSLLTWSGFAMASRSLPVFVLVSGLLGWAYRDRIRAEEEDYARRTWAARSIRVVMAVMARAAPPCGR
jgi:protein-S-isoprenylcysteine O-methyltransferase Ste14